MHQLIQYTLGIKEVCETKGNVAAVLLACRSVHGLPLWMQSTLVPYMPWKSTKARRGGSVFPSMPVSHASHAFLLS